MCAASAASAAVPTSPPMCCRSGGCDNPATLTLATTYPTTTAPPGTTYAKIRTSPTCYIEVSATGYPSSPIP
ncbi:hypothetical protein ACEUBZ_00535 [Aeromonas veronii]